MMENQLYWNSFDQIYCGVKFFCMNVTLRI